MRLTASAILGADDLAQEDVDCPEWGGIVTVRGLSVGELFAFRRVAQTTPDTVTGWLVAHAAIDEKGVPLFGADQAAALNARAPAPMRRLADAIVRLSRLDADPEEAAGN